MSGDLYRAGPWRRAVAATIPFLWGTVLLACGTSDHSAILAPTSTAALGTGSATSSPPDDPSMRSKPAASPPQGAGTGSDTQPAFQDLLVTVDAAGCSSTDPALWPARDPVIVVDNATQHQVAVVIGLYEEGYTYRDLVDYGPDVTKRPDFIEALDIVTVSPAGSRRFALDHGPGTYFVVCMPGKNTMTPLGDLTLVAVDAGTG